MPEVEVGGGGGAMGGAEGPGTAIVFDVSITMRPEVGCSERKPARSYTLCEYTMKMMYGRRAAESYLSK